MAKTRKPPKAKPGNIIYRNISVYEAALDRIRWLWDEFDGQVRVAFSGGKDSTVVLHLAKIVAEERGELPVKAYILDQEAEWQATRDYTRIIADLPWVDFEWYQVPFIIQNATNLNPADPTGDGMWLKCWEQPEPESGYIRPPEHDAIRESPYKTDHFLDWLKRHDGAWHGVTLTGIRTEESPSRLAGLTYGFTYRGIAWGSKTYESDSFRFAPIWDWTWHDVWKAIHDNDWPYCTLYDQQFRYGIPTPNMRVSSLMHDTAVRSLYYVHEFEPDTWSALTRRCEGVGATHHVDYDQMFVAPKNLPFMFSDWREYRDYLLNNLLPEDLRPQMAKKIKQMDKVIIGTPWDTPAMVKRQIKSILGGYHTNIDNVIMLVRGFVKDWRKEQAELGVIHERY